MRRKHPNWRAFYIQRRGAKKRGISFKLTFEEWLIIWNDSGHLHERGHKRGQYVMARYGDKGAYEKMNVRIILAGENVAEWCKGKPLSTEHRKKVSDTKRGSKLSAKHRRRISEAQIGRIVSKETREKIRRGNLGKKRSAETRRKVSAAKKGRPWSTARRISQEKRKSQFREHL